MATTVTQAEFLAKRTEGFNRIPVSRTVLADVETPLSAYAKLAQGPRSFLFESVEGGERWGRPTRWAGSQSRRRWVLMWTYDLWPAGLASWPASKT